MYAGHAAVALAIKTRAPRTSVALLTLAAFGPDWTELVLGLYIGRSGGEMYSHSLPGLAFGAAVAWGLYALGVDRAGARYIALAWLLHWPADFITAYKPLIDPRHVIGLNLYNLPKADFALEVTLVAIACVLYARAYAPTVRQRLWVAAAGLALAGLQGMLDFGLSRARPTWHPKLAATPWRPHARCDRADSVLPWTDCTVGPVRMALAPSPATFTASEQWRATASAVSSPWSV